MDIDKGLKYPFTGENLKAIMAGLDICKSDRILAVGGSGDQPLAFLEKAGEVVVVDSNPAQIDYIRARARLLMNGNYTSFLEVSAEGSNDPWLKGYCRYCVPELRRRNDYFGSDNRLIRIRENIDKLQICEPGNLFDIIRMQGIFSKIYLSNIYNYVPTNTNIGAISRFFNDLTKVLIVDPNLSLVSEHLGERGLVYFSERLRGSLGDYRIPANLALDQKHTELAEGSESENSINGKTSKSWYPRVYYKKSKKK